MRGAWRGDGEETFTSPTHDLIWLTREAGRSQPAGPGPGPRQVEEVGGWRVACECPCLGPSVCAPAATVGGLWLCPCLRSGLGWGRTHSYPGPTWQQRPSGNGNVSTELLLQSIKCFV